jgi:energy-coupling factor transporter ATP-binding protein EcfA2
MISDVAKDHIKNISQLVSLTLAGAKVKSLTIQERDVEFGIRPQIHLLLRANTGSLKSTILNEVYRLLRSNGFQNVVKLDEITRPGLVGTIDGRSMQYVDGAAWIYRNGVILFDEFKFKRKSEDWIAFLKLLEDQEYGRKIGTISSDRREADGDLYLIVSKGEIRMKTRFSAIIATMKRFETTASDYFKAFVNRCIPYEYNFTIQEIKDILMGGNLLKLKEFKVKDNIYVDRRRYSRILNFVEENITKDIVGQEIFARVVNDIVRVYAIIGRFDKDLFKKIIEWKADAYGRIGIIIRGGG